MAARMAISTVSWSRISPIMMISGSCLKIARNPLAKSSPAFGIDMDLVEAPDHIFHRVFHGDDVFADDIQFAQHRIKRGGLAASGGTGHQDDAMWILEQRLSNFSRLSFRES